MIRERANLVNRVHKTLEAANIKLTSVRHRCARRVGAHDAHGLLEGQTDTNEIADLAKGRCAPSRRRNRLGRSLKATHRFIVGELLSQIDGFDERIARFDRD